jgi:hypothetical protein
MKAALLPFPAVSSSRNGQIFSRSAIRVAGSVVSAARWVLVQLVTKSPARHSQPLPSAGLVTTSSGRISAIDNSKTTVQAIIAEAIASTRCLRQPTVIGVTPLERAHNRTALANHL